MIHRLLLSLVLLSGLSSCITFNTGAKLDSIGKAEPTLRHHDGQVYRLNHTLYEEVMVEYQQLHPKLIGYVSLPHDFNTCYDATPATEAPAPELYLASTDEHTSYIRAIDFPYTQAERVEEKAYLHDAFQHNDILTLTPSLYEGSLVLKDLPTQRTLGNKLRLPLSVTLSYGVDLPLTAASYVIGGVVQLLLMPFGIAI